MPREKIFKKEAVLHSATNLFWEKGFYQTSIHDLVHQSGINRASLYNTFHDKENLFLQCFLMYRSNVINYINDIIKSEKTIKNALKSLFHSLYEAYEKENGKGCLICNSYAELLPTKNIVIIELLNETKKIITNLIFQALKKAKLQKELKENTDVSLMTESIYSSMVGTAILSKVDKKQTIENKTLDHYLSMFN
jgi:TetR/AcrR family transcriptional repressor of nem operon